MKEKLEERYPSTSSTRRSSWWSVLCMAAAGCLLSVSNASSQLTISIAYHGPSAPTNGGSIDPGGAYIVNPGGSGPYPFWTSASLGLIPAAYNSAEVDALSWGQDALLTRSGSYWGSQYRFLFSTDEFASGNSAPLPSVVSEGVVGNSEASADVQLTSFFPSLPIPPWGSYCHASVFDGNGTGPFGGPGLGLMEPNTASPGPDPGDTLDALDMWAQSSAMRLYFSLDADWIDPLEGFYANAGTAQANGVNPGDILCSNGSGGFIVWASALTLGLDLNDDLDALILRENGDSVFTPSAQPFDWMGGTTDMLLFSVRRGSPVIGMPDSQFGLPIEEGDVLTTPCNIAPCVGGPYPAIFIQAESLCLGTVRSGTDAPFVGYGDELDAMMVR